MSGQKEKNSADQKLHSSVGPTIVESSVELAVELAVEPAVDSTVDSTVDSAVKSSVDSSVDSAVADKVDIAIELQTVQLAPPEPSLEAELRKVEAEVGTKEADFAKGLTDRLSNSANSDAREFATSMDNSADLAKVVGDPYSEEKHWYAACVEAGHRCLAGLPSPLKVVMVRLAAVVGVVFSFLSILACYTSSMYLSSHIGSMGLGLNNNLFLNDLVGLDYVGFFVAGAACLMFWSAFFGFFKRTFRYASIALFVGIMVHSINFHLILSIPVSIAVTVAYLPVLYLVEWVGGACREALPLHIGSKKLAATLLPSVAFPALAMLLSLLYIFSPWNPPGNSDYQAATAPTLAINAIAVLLCTFVPGFILARTTKSKSAIGSASLSVLLQTPVLVGLLLTIGACLALGMVYQTGIPSQPDFLWMQGFGGGDWAHSGGTKALSVFGGIAFAALSAFCGGALGAWCNNTFGVKANEKPLHSELR